MLYRIAAGWTFFCYSSWWKAKEDDIKIILIVKYDEGSQWRKTFEVDIFQDVDF